MDLEGELAAADRFIAEYAAKTKSFAPIVEGHEPATLPGRAGLAGLSRLDSLRRTVVLVRLLRAQVTTSHYHVWRFCAAYSDRRWSELTDSIGITRGTEDTFHASATVLFGMLVPPQIAIDATVRHALLGPLAFTLVEGCLRRGSSGHLDDAGIVQRAFTVGGEAYAQGQRCNRLEHAALLQQHLLDVNDPHVARAFELLRDELHGVLGPTAGGVWHELDRWRDEWLHRRRPLANQVPLLACVVAFLVIARMTDGDYADVLGLRKTETRSVG